MIYDDEMLKWISNHPSTEEEKVLSEALLNQREITRRLMERIALLEKVAEAARDCVEKLTLGIEMKQRLAPLIYALEQKPEGGTP